MRRRPPVRVATAVCLVVSLIATSAQAQEYGRRRNLLDMLFGAPRYERPEPPPVYDRGGSSVIDVAPRRSRSTQKAVTPRPVGPVESPQVEAVAKLENARKILVIGDFLAGGVGGALETTFQTSPGVQIIERSDGSSGLVRTDHYDWQSQLPAILDEVKPAIVVVMVGANDRQQMAIGNAREKFRTDAWFKEYESRVTALATTVTARKLPLLWVGLPSFQSPSMMADAVTLNTIYRNQAEKTGAEFVDVWDGFVDEEGKFILTGSDVNGQQVRLRGSDGIVFTKAGKEKLAFYVEKFLRRHLGEMASPDIAHLEKDGQLPPLSMMPSPINPALPAQPISLLDPKLDGGDELLGAAAPMPQLVETARDKLIKRGELDPAPVGRIDNYRVVKTP